MVNKKLDSAKHELRSGEKKKRGQLRVGVSPWKERQPEGARWGGAGPCNLRKRGREGPSSSPRSEVSDVFLFFFKAL